MLDPNRRALLGTLALVSGCSISTSLGGGSPEPVPEPGVAIPPMGTLNRASKVDLLFAIDNSRSMSDKQALLREAVPDFVGRLVSPHCVNEQGGLVGPSVGAVCASGRLEAAPITDLHVGVVTSSLGTGTACKELPNRHNNDRGHLVARSKSQAPLASLRGEFLSLGPDGVTDAATLVKDVQTLVEGVGEDGCGFEANLESIYRFLVQPAPWKELTVDAEGHASPTGVDETILRQRRAFLRPDSLLVVVLLADENDASVDPMALHGQAWAFAESQFPGSPTGSAPYGTIECANPMDPACTTCAFLNAGDPRCPRGTYLEPHEDPISLRFWEPKKRFGVDPLFPLRRYVNGLSSAKVPSLLGEHPPDPAHPGTSYDRYIGKNDCDNPIFSAELPFRETEDLCHLTPGPRSQELVLLSVIGGAPPALVTPAPGETRLSASAWTALLGANPDAKDETGIDPHMIESVAPRAGLPATTDARDADPAHGRERDTKGDDLQYACTFPLSGPGRNCEGDLVGGCDCPDADNPICSGANLTLQTRGKAYPSRRAFEVARALGDRAVVSSICPLASGATTPQHSGYRPALSRLGDRLVRAMVSP